MRKQLLIAFSLFTVSGWFSLAAPASACQATISGNASVSGSWFATCASANRRGAYAQYYTFTLTETSVVQIDLESSSIPTSTSWRETGRSTAPSPRTTTAPATSIRGSCAC
jgi:hypothetical protein